MGIQTSKIFCFLFAALSFGCAGPTSPFGAIHSLSSAPKNKQIGISGQPKIEPSQNPMIFISPERQVLHDLSNVKVTVLDPRGVSEKSSLHVFYNDINVTNQFFKTATSYVDHENSSLVTEFRKLRLQPGKMNKIRFEYIPNKTSAKFVENYQSPNCYLDDPSSVKHTGKFRPDANILKIIEKQSLLMGKNPSLMTGLIAQESSFDPNAVSWAKAMGLTQVTPIADREIAKIYSSWPRSDKVLEYPAPILKTMVATGQIAPHEDWRLKPELSVKGGITMLNFVQSYWSNQKLQSKVKEDFHNPQDGLSKLVLASYHSGPARVKSIFLKTGNDFLLSEKLTEAAKYVDKVSSYCYHFSKERL